MVAAVRVHKAGGPEVLTYEDVDLPAPGPGQIRIKQAACGVNYIDTYFRQGMYPPPNGYPFIDGNEGSGDVVAVGSGVTDIKVGDRVAAVAPLGGYASERILPADRAVKVPANISHEQAAGMMLKGMTAEYLLRRTYPVKPGDIVLLHAAAGGVGQIATQWLRHLGATIIGTAGSPEKLRIAQTLGCHHVINYRDPDWVAQVKAASGGKGVHVVYDGVGKDTFLPSLDCLRPRGYMVTYGNASGPVAPIEPLLLSQKGSLFLTRPTLMAYTGSREDLELSARTVIDVISRGIVNINVSHTYPLKEAAQAHRDLEARKTTGSVVLLP
jgi:NADPH:quinone reductase